MNVLLSDCLCCSLTPLISTRSRSLVTVTLIRFKSPLVGSSDPATISRVKQGANGFTVMDAAHSFGECRRHRQYLELGHAFFGGDRDRVGGNDFEHVVLLVEAIESAGGEQAMSAGEA
jgi:hypothetical protein